MQLAGDGKGALQDAIRDKRMRKLGAVENLQTRENECGPSTVSVQLVTMMSVPS